MFLKIDGLNEGGAPSEAIATIGTNEGPEEITVHQSQIQDNQMEVGFIGKSQGKGVLVELPRETLRGKWRVWVDESKLVMA